VARPAILHSLLVPLDRDASGTLQQQLCDGLRRAISAGRLAPGARIPSARLLTSMLRISRTTVSLALQQLVDEGLLIARARSGTFVAPDASPSRPVTTPARTDRSAVRLSRRAAEMALRAHTFHGPRPRPRAFPLSRPALDLFPVRDWNRLLAKRAGRLTVAQLDYDQESPLLRAAIAGLVSASRGVQVQADQVLLFAGSQRALEFATRCVLDRGDSAWMEEPGYPGARQVLLSAGAKVVSVPVDAEGLVVRAGERKARGARLVYATPSNQFPLGVTMTMARRRELLRWAEAAGACIVEDDYDVEFSAEGAALPSLQAMDSDARVFYVNSFSRTLFPAIRLGYLIAPASLADQLRAVRATLEEQLPSLVQLALADFIAEGHFARHVRRMQVAYRARREALVEAVGATGQLRLRSRPQGLHAVVDLPEGADPERVAAAAALRRIEALPLGHFGAGAGRSAPALVLGFGAVRPGEMAAAVRELSAAVDETRRA
jgi:GntR family transcriptional regulator/MocR family aminotransferase